MDSIYANSSEAIRSKCRFQAEFARACLLCGDIYAGLQMVKIFVKKGLPFSDCDNILLEGLSEANCNEECLRLFHRIREAQKTDKRVILDRSIYEDAEIFVENLHRRKGLSKRDYNTYMQLYNFTVANLLRPTLLVYLRASVPTLVSQIQRRGRVYETAIDSTYLEGLNQLYEAWIGTYEGPKLIVDVDHEDFVTDPAARENILTHIEQLIHGHHE